MTRTLARLGLAAIVVAIVAADGHAIGWHRTPLPLQNGQIQAIAPATNPPGRVYAAPFARGVLRTDDRGSTWQSMSRDLPLDTVIYSLSVSAHDGDVVYAGGLDRVFRTLDGGISWEEGGSGLADGIVISVDVPGANPDVAVAAVLFGSQDGVYRTTDGGLTWSRTTASFGHLESYVVSARPDDPSTILAGTAGGVLRSTDGGATWSVVLAGTFVGGIAWSGSVSGLAYALDASGDVYLTGDGGASFFLTGTVPLGFDGAPTSIDVDPNVAGRVLVGGTRFCTRLGTTVVWESTTAGTSWSTLLEEDCGYATMGRVAFEPGSSDHVYLGEQGDYHRGFRHSTDGGATWTVKIDGIRNYGISNIAGDDAGTIYAISQELFRSGASLNQWTGTGIPGPNPLSFPFLDSFDANLRTPGLLFRSGIKRPGDISLQFFEKSTDGGDSWCCGSPAGLTFGSPIRSIVTNHGDGSTVYAVGSGMLHRSDDGGDTFVSVGYNPAEHHVVDPDDPLRIFDGGNPSVRISEDGGVTWTMRDGGLPAIPGTASVSGFFMDPGDGDVLLIVLSDGSIYETENGGLGWSLRDSLDLQGSILFGVTWEPGTRHAYASTRDVGVISTNPQLKPFGLTTRNVNRIYFSSATRTVFVTSLFAGLFHQQLPVSAVAPDRRVLEPIRPISVSPNPGRAPSIGFAVPATGGHVTLGVFDLRGRQISGLVDGWRSAGPQRVIWDGRDARGRSVPVGVYFVRLSVGSRTEVGRITITR